MRIKRFLKAILPPFLANAVRRGFVSHGLEPVRFTGDYKSWEEAEKASTGYTAPEILTKTRDALLKVKAGGAAFERDSITFEEMHHNFP